MASEPSSVQPPARLGVVPLWLVGLVPLLLVGAVLVLFFALGGTGIGKPRGAPPQEELSVDRTVLRPGQIELHVRNNGLDAVTVREVSVDDRYVSFTGGDRSIGHLESHSLVLSYPWIGSETYEVSLLLSTGTTIETKIAAAVETPKATLSFYGLMALLGTYVGIIPVMLGMLWLPFFRSVGWRWFRFLMAITIGLLLFLVVDATLEGLQTAQESAPAFGGPLLVFAGALLAYLVLRATDAHLRPEGAMRPEAGDAPGSFVGSNVALLVAIGIGLHNLSEGLGIGAAYAVGAFAFGTFLVVGFTIQNVTEGLAIVAPISRAKPSLVQLATLGMIAGAPAIFGAWMGSIVFNASLAAFLFGVAAGAIVQVAEVIWPAMRDKTGHSVNLVSVGGIALGFFVLYVTSLFT
jgi:ZIP family zinc transporter